MSLQEKVRVVTKSGAPIDDQVKRLRGGIYIDHICEGMVMLWNGYFIPDSGHCCFYTKEEFHDDLEKFLEKYFREATAEEIAQRDERDRLALEQYRKSRTPEDDERDRLALEKERERAESVIKGLKDEHERGLQARREAAFLRR